MATLENVRAEIDALDQQLQLMINQRADLAGQIGEIKRSMGEGHSFYRPEREAQVLRRIKNRNEGPLDGDTVAVIFREIMSACLALEKQLTVAYLGPEGSYTQGALIKQFGQSVKELGASSIADIFREVESGSATYGVVPVENSTEGMVSDTLDRFLSSPLHICGEVTLPIRHQLLSHDAEFGNIKRLYSHQQSLAQCRSWLAENLPETRLIAVSSNSEAARQASKEWSSAAIAGEVAAKIYNLPIRAKNIQDQSDNTTRFLVIGHENIPPSGQDKTSLVLSVPNEPGALCGLLRCFQEEGISMTRIESRPSRHVTWEYVYHIDAEGHKNDSAMKSALAAIADRSSMFRILGSYPRSL